MIYLAIEVLDDLDDIETASIGEIIPLQTYEQRSAVQFGYEFGTRDANWLAFFPSSKTSFEREGSSVQGVYEMVQIAGLRWCLENPHVLVAGINYQADLLEELKRHLEELTRLLDSNRIAE